MSSSQHARGPNGGEFSSITLVLYPFEPELLRKMQGAMIAVYESLCDESEYMGPLTELTDGIRALGAALAEHGEPRYYLPDGTFSDNPPRSKTHD